MFDDFWKIAGCIVAGSAAYLVGKSNGQAKIEEKYARDQEIAELREKIKQLEQKRGTDDPSKN